MKKGKFIVVEGIDYSGKTTYIKKLKKELEKEGLKVLTTCEPKGIKFGRIMANKIFFNDKLDISSRTKAVLFIGIGWELFMKYIKPQLKKYDVVICDRYIFSTYAYQVFGGDKTINEHELLGLYNETILDDYFPDEIHFLDCPTTEIMRRATIRKPTNNYDEKCLDKKYVNLIRSAFRKTFDFFNAKGGYAVKQQIEKVTIYRKTTQDKELWGEIWKKVI